MRQSSRPQPSDAAPIAGNFRLRNLRRDEPYIERIAREVFRAGDAHPPAFQRDDLDVELLTGSEINLLVLVEVSAEALGRNVIMPRRNIAIKRAAVCDSPNIAAVHGDPGEVETFGGFIGPVKPHPSLSRGEGDRHAWRRWRTRAARRDQQQPARPLRPSSRSCSGIPRHGAIPRYLAPPRVS